ncbi:MAG: glycosyltransferase family 4 protein [Chloroflexota bacterium]
MKQQKLTLICQHFYPEMLSTGLVMTQLMVGLARKGWQIRVYCGQPTYSDEADQWTAGHDDKVVVDGQPIEGIEIIRIRTLGGARGWLPIRALNAIGFLLSICWLLLRDRNQIQGIINSTNPPFIGVAACLFKLLTQKRFITIVHDVYPDVAVSIGLIAETSWIARVWKQVTKMIFQQSSALVVLGRDMEQLVHERYFLPKGQDDLTKKYSTKTPQIIRIPNWADETHLRPIAHGQNGFRDIHNPAQHFLVQYAGRMGRTHTLEPLIEAAERLQNHPVLFQLIGDGAKQEALMAMVRERNLQNVQFLSYQPYAHLAEVISAADLAVVCLDSACTGVSVPSKTYGILACARPILALVHADSEIGQVVQETQCGWVLSDNNDSAFIGREIATQIQHRLNNPDLGIEQGKNGNRAFHTTYRLENAVARYDQLLREHFL